MKKLINVFVFFLFVATMTACGGSPAAKFVGKWKIDTIDGKGAGKMGDVVIEFKKDGEMETVMGSKANKAKYEVSKDGKELTLKDASGKGKDEKFTGVEFEKDKMMATSEGKKFVFKKQ